MLGISKVTLWRLLNGRSPVDNEKLVRVLQLLSPSEFEAVLGAAKKLVAAGILREDGTVDYAAALEVLALATRDEYLKQAVLRFVVQNFRDDLRRARAQGKKLGRPPYPFPAEEVRKLLARGYSIAEVHRLLVLEGRVCREVNGRRECMKYETFERKVRELLKQEP